MIRELAEYLAQVRGHSGQDQGGPMDSLTLKRLDRLADAIMANAAVEAMKYGGPAQITPERVAEFVNRVQTNLDTRSSDGRPY